MCYSAQITSDYRKYQRLGRSLSLNDFAALWIRDPAKEKKRPKAPKALEELAASMDPAIRRSIEDWNALETSELEPELLKQRKRVADAERKLLTKVTKKAQDDVRIGNNKVKQIKGWLDDFKRNAGAAGRTHISPMVCTSHRRREWSASGKANAVPMPSRRNAGKQRLREGWKVEWYIQRS